MISHEYIIKKLQQKKQKKKFLHKVKYGIELKEEYGYDWKSHREEARKMGTDRLVREYFRA